MDNSSSRDGVKDTTYIHTPNDRASEAHQTDTQKLKHHHVAGAHRAGLQLGDTPEHSLTKDDMPELELAAAAAETGRPQALVLPTSHATAPPAAADASPAAAACSPVSTVAAHHGVNLASAAAHTSSHDSAGTGMVQAGQQQYKSTPSKQQYGQGFVPRKDSNDNIPCFVQTSALFTNVSGNPALDCGVTCQQLLCLLPRFAHAPACSLSAAYSSACK